MKRIFGWICLLALVCGMSAGALAAGEHLFYGIPFGMDADTFIREMDAAGISMVKEEWTDDDTGDGGMYVATEELIHQMYGMPVIISPLFDGAERLTGVIVATTDQYGNGSHSTKWSPEDLPEGLPPEEGIAAHFAAFFAAATKEFGVPTGGAAMYDEQMLSGALLEDGGLDARVVERWLKKEGYVHITVSFDNVECVLSAEKEADDDYGFQSYLHYHGDE